VAARLAPAVASEQTARMAVLSDLRGRPRGEWLADAVVLGGLTGFVLVVYTTLVVGGGFLLGRVSWADLALSVIATAAIALSFDRVHARFRRAASRWVHGGLPSPDEVMREFSGTVSGTYATEDLPTRMAQLLAEGTGAQWAQVWLMMGTQPKLAATWPPPEANGAAGVPDVLDPRNVEDVGRRALEVRHGGELLGVLVLQERAKAPLSSVEQRLFSGLAGQAGLVLRGARLRAELEHRAEELAARADELRLSRQRLVDDQDLRRRSLERDIHDGAQQHLVALSVNLRLAQTLADTSPERAVTLLAKQKVAAGVAVDTLVQLSRGIYPQRLAEGGLPTALAAAARVIPIPVSLDLDGIGRFLPRIEAAAYFCCLEALQNAAKHSGATRIRICVREERQDLVITVDDDGSGFDAENDRAGSGLTNMRDRIESLHGTIRLTSSTQGTCVRATLPAVGVA
jgi:signal transduction histidine kinase